MSRFFALFVPLALASLIFLPSTTSAQSVQVNKRHVVGKTYEYWLTCDKNVFCDERDTACVECGIEGPEHYFHFTWRFEDHWYEIGDTVRWTFGAKPAKGDIVIFATRKYTDEDPEKNMKRIVPDDEFLGGIGWDPGDRWEEIQGDSVSIEITRNPRQTFESGSHQILRLCHCSR